MNNRIESSDVGEAAAAPQVLANAVDENDDNAPSKTLNPKPGEAGIPNVATRPSISISVKSLFTVGLLICSLVAVSAFSIQRYVFSGKKPDDTDAKRVSDRPAAATTEPRKLEMPPPRLEKPVSAVVATLRVPALLPDTDGEARPIGVRRTGQGALGTRTATGTNNGKSIPPEDAPVLVVSSKPGSMGAPNATPLGSPSLKTPPTQPDAEAAEALDPNDPLAATSRNLQGYQRQLQGLLDSMTQSAALATAPTQGQSSANFFNTPMGATPFGMPPSAGTPTNAPTGATAPNSASTPTVALFGGQLQSSATPRVAASMLGNRSLTLPKGTAFTCALKTKLISATSGLVGCQVQRNVFSDDGRVLLIERGSHLDGEYRIASVRPGMVRIPVLWTRLRTPHGVTVEIESPGTGPLGESGVDGYVDNRWFERIGAAMLLSLIDDSVKLVIQSQANQNDSGGANTIVLPSTTSNASKLAEKVLDSTINIPPLIYQNQGGIVGIYVARDVDFSTVYELKPTARNPASEVRP
jgi:type IV secretion system protein VirB10